MRELIEKYLDRVKGLKSEGTYKARLTDLRNFDSWLDAQGYDDVTALKPLDLEDYFIHLNNQGYAMNTVEGRYESVRGFYQFLAEKMELFEDSPFESLSRSDYLNGSETMKSESGSIIYLSPDEKELMCEHAPAPAFRNELTYRLLWQTGMRCGELCRVELADIDRETRAIDVYSTKTGAWRTVYYQPSLDVLLEQWVDGGYRSSYSKADSLDQLLITRRGALNENHLNRLVRETAEAAGIQEVLYEDAAGKKRYRVTSHTFRHSHAVHALKSGIDVRTVQKHLGHEQLETTMEYLQLIDSDVRESYRRFGMEAEA